MDILEAEVNLDHNEALIAKIKHAQFGRTANFISRTWSCMSFCFMRAFNFWFSTRHWTEILPCDWFDCLSPGVNPKLELDFQLNYQESPLIQHHGCVGPQCGSCALGKENVPLYLVLSVSSIGIQHVPRKWAFYLSKLWAFSRKDLLMNFSFLLWHFLLSGLIYQRWLVTPFFYFR